MPVPGYEIAANPRRVRARIENHVIADTREALTVRGADGRRVHYFPRQDVETGFLSPGEPDGVASAFGEATRYSLMIDGALEEDAAWSFEEPEPQAAALKGRLAFDTGRIEVYELDRDP